MMSKTLGFFAKAEAVNIGAQPPQMLSDEAVPFGGLSIPSAAEVLSRALGRDVSVEVIVAHLESGRLRLMSTRSADKFHRAIRQRDIELLAAGSGWWTEEQKR